MQQSRNKANENQIKIGIKTLLLKKYLWPVCSDRSNKEQLPQSTTGGALQPLTSIRPVMHSEMKAISFQNLLWYQLLLTLSHLPTSLPTS